MKGLAAKALQVLAAKAVKVPQAASTEGGSEALGEATTAPLRTAVEVTLHGGFDLKSAQASIAHRPTRPAHT
jgi:hypothetical protein